MSSLAAAVLLLASLASDALHVGVDRGPEEVVIRFELLAEMPESVVNTVSSGARVEIDYALRVYGRRRMFPDRRIWKGVAQSTVTFDAITGRYVSRDPVDAFGPRSLGCGAFFFAEPRPLVGGGSGREARLRSSAPSGPE